MRTDLIEEQILDEVQAVFGNEELSAQIQQLEDRRRILRESRSSLDLPAIETDFLNEILTNL